MLLGQHEKSFLCHNFPSDICRGKGGVAQSSSSWGNQEKYFGGTEDNT